MEKQGGSWSRAMEGMHRRLAGVVSKGDTWEARLEAAFTYFPSCPFNSLEKTLMLGKIEGKRRKGWQRVRWLDSLTDSMDMNLSKLQEAVKDRGA